jgi:hypothetical protein
MAEREREVVDPLQVVDDDERPPQCPEPAGGGLEDP